MFINRYMEPESTLQYMCGARAAFWHDKNVLVTGSNGFVGSWLTRRLVQEKANVVSIIRDNHKMSSLQLVCGKEFFPETVVYGDITDYNLVSRVLTEYDIQIVMHLAAQAIVTTANRNPLSTFHSNIEGTWNILESCRNSSVSSIVMASSDKSYGEPKKVPITEDHPLLASHPYDASKACGEILARSYAKSYGLPVVVSRCSNIYGGADLNFNRIVPDTIRSVLTRKNPIIRSDGSPIRDYSYIDDIVNGYLLLAEAMTNDKKWRGEAFNFGTNKPTTVLNLVSKIIEISGQKNIKPIIKNDSKNEIQVQYLDSTKSNRLLGWQPSVDLEEGLKRSVTWYKKYLTQMGVLSN